MSYYDNHQTPREYFIYISRTNQRIPVDKEAYYTYYRPIWAQFKRAHAHGQCSCPGSLWRRCEGDCCNCEYRRAGDSLSLDYTIADDNGNEKSWLEDLADDTPAMQSIMEDRELLDALHKKLDKLDPDGRRICELIMQGCSERDCGKEMGIARNTFVYKRDKLLTELAEYLKDFI